MKIEIEQFITNNYYELLKITKKITNNSDWSQDLLHNVITQLYDRESINLHSLDDKTIKFYIIGIIKINWTSKTSPFYRKIKMESSLYNELTTQNDNIREDVINEHQLMEIIENEWAETDFFHKVIFEKYLTMGSLKKVAQSTTIPLPSVARYVQETKKTIKANTFRKLDL